ncbi:Linoleate 13S-lipoxygenase 2-1, chloroplastic [Morella rubra]|uniref:Linoleate 13S-lipoxygenase 2-1, chloroplastic n=1 Tax=Morella rubra TaxID=262757 RepID=A0A6A1VC89_9ROSI|nr:Linoleate 13S-lipoxygenase 2-1, chloroplastic [Morella rubra]
MLKPQVSHSNTAETLFLLHKPIFSYGINGSASLPFWSKSVFRQSHKSLQTGFLLSNIKAVASTSTSTANAPETYIGVKAIVIVKPTVRGFFSNLGLERGLDDIQDFLGETPPGVMTGLEKDTIQAFAHKAGRRDEGVKYETDFEVPFGFGEVGAVLAENEQHREMFLQDIVLDGFPDGPVNVTCRSWVHSKFKNPEKRVFFTTKPQLMNADPLSETRCSRFYFPRDECFSEIKAQTFSAKTVYSVLRVLVLSLRTVTRDGDDGFPYFTAIDALFTEGVHLPTEEGQKGFLRGIMPRLVKAIGETGGDVLRFETTETMSCTETNPHKHFVSLYLSPSA